ncbi:MAG: hypothetical protein JWP15_1765 [Alphaproteobacteria bacterium]|nr:hypothetical protein [Alphaproteobacteria bacterium]
MKLIATFAALSALLAVTPAIAQRDRSYAGSSEMQMQMALRIDRGVDNGVISPREAGALRLQLGALRQLDARYSRNGFAGAERGDLIRRGEALRGQVALAERSGDDDGSLPANPGNRNGAAGDNVANWSGLLARDNRGDRFDGDFRVGQRSPAELVALPARYHARYPDDRATYYRYNQGRIYQIERNSNLILRMLDPRG